MTKYCAGLDLKLTKNNQKTNLASTIIYSKHQENKFSVENLLKVNQKAVKVLSTENLKAVSENKAKPMIEGFKKNSLTFVDSTLTQNSISQKFFEKYAKRLLLENKNLEQNFYILSPLHFFQTPSFNQFNVQPNLHHSWNASQLAFRNWNYFNGRLFF